MSIWYRASPMKMFLLPQGSLMITKIDENIHTINCVFFLQSCAKEIRKHEFALYMT